MICLDSNGTVQGPGGIYFFSLQATLDIVMLMLVIIINAFIIVSILTSRLSKPAELWVSRASSRFIANLAAADVWVALTSLYYISFRYLCVMQFSGRHEKWICLLRFFLLTHSLLTSACGLAAIALDRYVAVVHALRYRELMSHRRSSIMIVTAWCLPVVLSLPVFLWHYWTPGIECEVVFVIPFAYVCCVGMLTHGLIVTVVTVTHYRIHREALKISSRRRSRESGTAFCSSETLTTLAKPPTNSKSARTVLLVTGCYLTCWTPYTALYIARVAGYSTPLFELCFSLSHTFADINYIINPFIYAWRNASVKSAIIRTCKRLALFKGSPSINIAINSQVQRVT